MKRTVTFKAADFFGFENYFEISETQWCHTLPTDLERIWIALGHEPLCNREECLWAMENFGTPCLVYIGRGRTIIEEVVLRSPEIYERVRGLLLANNRMADHNDREFFNTMRLLIIDAVRIRDKRSNLGLDGWKWGVGHPFWAWLHAREGFCIEFHSWIQKYLYIYRSLIAEQKAVY